MKRERYSPFMIGEHIQKTQAEEASDDETTVADTDSGTRLLLESISLIASDDEFPLEKKHIVLQLVQTSQFCVPKYIY